MAMHVEEAGRNFYQHLAENNQNEAVKKVFLLLAEQESRHYSDFKRIALEMKQNDVEQEYSIDVASLFKQSIEKLRQAAFNHNLLTKESLDLKGCLDIAIHAEEQAINIYEQIYKNFTQRYYPVVMKIISEEKKHLTMLLNAKQTSAL